jgi:hypothetical protein
MNMIGAIIRTGPYKLHTAARLYLSTAIAMNDACIATWSAKYKYPLLRPISYIQKYIDSTWYNPALIDRIENPYCPEYVSCHTAVGFAAVTALQWAVQNPKPFTDLTHVASGYLPRDYYTLNQLQSEILRSQEASGTQYQFSINAGKNIGSDIGNLVSGRLLLRK